jgi:uncharacterized protein
VIFVCIRPPWVADRKPASLTPHWHARRLARSAAGTALRSLFLVLLFASAVRSWCQTTVNIHAIQSSLPASPYLGDSVTTTGIVIAVLSDGFYIENTSSNYDSDICTAEGIFVYTPAGVPSNVALQDSITVTGIVQASNSSDYAGTQIYISSADSTNVVLNSTGNTLPSAVTSTTLTSATTGGCSLYSSNSFGQWLPFEGMRVNVPSSSSLMVTGGTGGTVTASSQSAVTNGQFWAVLTTTRPFRSSGISMLQTLPSTAPSTVARWSGNPQLLLVDTTTLGGTAINAPAGTIYTGSSNLIGIVDYHVSTAGYTGLLLTSDTVNSLTASNTISPTKATSPSSYQITIATQDADSLTASETTRIAKLANAIVNYENSPDVLAIQGITPAALNLLQSAIESNGGPSYSLGTAVSTADSDGLVNAFLLNASTLDSPEVAQALATTTYTTTSNTSATLFGRSPLVLTAGIPRSSTSDYNFVVVNSSFLSRDNIDDTTEGPEVRLQRAQQAEALSAYLEPLESASKHIFVAGGFDAFEFSDGFTDALGILDGSEPVNTSNGTLVTLYDSSYNTTALGNTTLTATNLSTGATNTATQRYTYVENGSAEQPDHILITTELDDLVSIDYARIGADFPVVSTYASSTVARASSHDGIVAYLTVPYPSSVAISSSLNPSYYHQDVTFTATVTSESSLTPTGTVTFYDGSTALAAETLSSGSASYTTSALSVGSHTITAAYEGDTAHDSASASLTQVVEALLTTGNVLACSPNPAAYGATVTCTDTVSSASGVPSGTVTFYDGSTALGTTTLSSGVATYSTSTLSVGSHTLTAVYAESAPYAASTSNTVDEVISSTFALSISPASRTIYTGEAATYTVTVTPGDGFALDVALTCSGVPSGSTCVITPSTVSGGSGTAKLVIQSTAPSKSQTVPPQFGKAALPTVLCGAFFLFSRRRASRAVWMLVLLITSFWTAAAVTGCGGSKTLTGGTTPGAYTITVTGVAADGSLSITQTATASVTIKSLF